MENIVFDLGGVVVARDKSRCPADLIQFFSFIFHDPMPRFWVEYDRGTLSREEVERSLARETRRTQAECRRYLDQAIALQEQIPQTADLIAALHASGYRLYVLSNMSREFIRHIRSLPVYRYFSGEVVSCEEGTVKPEAEIYRLLLSRYGLDPSRTLFVDDRPENLEAAAAHGLHTFHFSDRSGSCEALRQMLHV